MGRCKPSKSHISLCSGPRLTKNLSYPVSPPTRAVLSLDDDILLPCTDVERAFALWRASPRQLVGWYPRLLQPAGGKDAQGPPVYQFEPAVFKQVGDEGGAWCRFEAPLVWSGCMHLIAVVGSAPLHATQLAAAWPSWPGTAAADAGHGEHAGAVRCKITQL